MDTSPWGTWLSASVLSPSASSYVAYLHHHGYSAPIAGAYLHAVGHFAHWLSEARLPLRVSMNRWYADSSRRISPRANVRVAVNGRSSSFRPRSDICCTSYVQMVGSGHAASDCRQRFTTNWIASPAIWSTCADWPARPAPVADGGWRSSWRIGLVTDRLPSTDSPAPTLRTTSSETGRVTRQAAQVSAAAPCAATCVSAPPDAVIAWSP